MGAEEEVWLAPGTDRGVLVQLAEWPGVGVGVGVTVREVRSRRRPCGAGLALPASGCFLLLEADKPFQRESCAGCELRAPELGSRAGPGPGAV